MQPTALIYLRAISQGKTFLTKKLQPKYVAGRWLQVGNLRLSFPPKAANVKLCL